MYPEFSFWVLGSADTTSTTVGVFGVGQAHSSAMAFKAWTAPTLFLVGNFHISVRARTHVHEIYFKRLPISYIVQELPSLHIIITDDLVYNQHTSKK